MIMIFYYTEKQQLKFNKSVLDRISHKIKRNLHCNVLISFKNIFTKLLHIVINQFYETFQSDSLIKKKNITKQFHIKIIYLSNKATRKICQLKH